MKKHSSNQQVTRIVSRDVNREKFTFFIGIDLGDKNSDFCVLNQEGEGHCLPCWSRVKPGIETDGAEQIGQVVPF